MKGTRHNGRSGKNGVYNPLHNDRRFNPEHSEHIDNSLLQPKTKVKVVNEIKEKARPSIMSRLAEKKKELAEREANKKNDLKKSWNRDDR